MLKFIERIGMLDMTVEEVFRHYGSRRSIADEVGITYQAVVGWEQVGKISFTRQCHIELLTEGKLIASRQDAA